MDNLNMFETACEYFLKKITEFKEILSIKVNKLNNKDWLFNKESIKTCQADETGKKRDVKLD